MSSNGRTDYADLEVGQIYMAYSTYISHYFVVTRKGKRDVFGKLLVGMDGFRTDELHTNEFKIENSRSYNAPSYYLKGSEFYLEAIAEAKAKRLKKELIELVKGVTYDAGRADLWAQAVEILKQFNPNSEV
jgi:hypothetical protein